MTHNSKISISMPDLSPEAAYVLTEWLEILTHEVNLYYADLIRSYMASCEQEEIAIDHDFDLLAFDNEHQEELPF